jgi:hypothetical protein
MAGKGTRATASDAKLAVSVERDAGIFRENLNRLGRGAGTGLRRHDKGGTAGAEIDFPGGLTRSTHPVWLTPDAVRAPLPPEVLTPPTELTGTVLSASGADLTWTRTSLQESGFEIQRRIVPSGSAAVLNPPLPVNGIWTWTPGLEGRFEIAARSTRTPNGETRAP